MRLGFLGPCRGDLAVLRPLAELLLFEFHVDRAIYLGADDALERATKDWHERFQAPPDEPAFLREAALLAPDAPPEILEALIERDRKLHRLADLAMLPPPPSRAVEMFEDRVVLMVYDKSVLDEDDVANASIIVWGHAQDAQMRAIGPRVFLTPGSASASSGPHVALVERDEDAILCSLRDHTGKVTMEHRIPLTRGAKLGVQ